MGDFTDLYGTREGGGFASASGPLSVRGPVHPGGWRPQAISPCDVYGTLEHGGLHPPYVYYAST